jgi:hypothetical protein
MKLFQIQRLYSGKCDGRMIMDCEFIRIWKEAAMTYFKTKLWHASVDTEENKKFISYSL